MQDDAHDSFLHIVVLIDMSQKEKEEKNNACLDFPKQAP
jgi:hypothetical protein